MACYVPQPIDHEIARYVDGWNEYDAARARGIYDERLEKKSKKRKKSQLEKLDLSNPRKVAEILAEQEARGRSYVMNVAATNIGDTFKKLRDAYAGNNQAKMDRINMVAYLFSRVVDQTVEANAEHGINRTRMEILNGYEENGVSLGGQFRIFDAVYNQLRYMYSEFMSEGDFESAEEINKVLDNWGAITAFARIVLRDTEGVKLGNTISYADTAEDSMFGNNDISDSFLMEESKREGWQEMTELISSFGTIGKAVRRVLRDIQEVDYDQKIEDLAEGYDEDEAGLVTDDLGFARKLNPVTAHQMLMEYLNGVTTETELMEALSESPEVTGIPWLNQVRSILLQNPTVRTQFLNDFNKDFQFYRMMTMKIKNGYYEIKTFIKNKTTNLLGGEYRVRLRRGNILGNNSIYTSTGEVNWANIRELRNTVIEWFDRPVSEGVGGAKAVGKSKFWNKSTSWEARTQVVSNVLQALGIQADKNTVSTILRSRNGSKFTQAIAELFTHIKSNGESVSTGFDAILDSSQLKALKEGNTEKLSDIAPNIRTLIKMATVTQSKRSKKGNVEEKIDKLLDTIADTVSAKKVESRISYKNIRGKNVTMFSHVNASYLGTFIKKINRFAKKGDRQGLRQFLDARYGDSSMFKLNGQWLNRWLEDLYNDDLSEAGAFAETLMFSRFLGEDDTVFENFTSKQHAIDMLNEFSFGENSTDGKGHRYGHFPVFILGDSGVSKYIKAKIYREEEIFEGLWNVYQSEIRKQELAEKSTTDMKNKGIVPHTSYSGKKHTTFTENAKKFTILKVLNDAAVQEQIRADINRGKTEKEAIIDALRRDFDQKIQVFTNNMASLGVLDKAGRNSKYLKAAIDQYGGSQEAFIRDFYLNTAFATIQQLQLMTIDPGFYESIKDLQKRYKEIHAPGTMLSTEATWTDGTKFSEDGIERCIYFQDIKVEADGEFMKAIREQFGEGSKQWEDYMNNTLTDGQGYRSLDSYRKVMGMAGKWTEEMEKVYRDIKALRAKYSDPDDIIPASELNEIAKQAVVFMPIKPYMYTIENYDVGDDVLKIPVQHKYAEAVLIPELLPPGSMLRDMGRYMEENNVDLVASTKVVKVGCFGQTDIKGTPDRNSLYEALGKAYVHKLDYADYKIQTNVPEHVNGSQLFGTQIRKLIMGNIDMDGDYTDYIPDAVDGKVNLGGGNTVRLNGRNLVNFYNSLIVSNILEAFDSFAQQMDNPKELSKILQQNVISTSRESMEHLVAYSLTGDDKFLIPLFEGGLEHDSAALLLSLFKKAVNKQYIRGGSAVQVSALGISGYEEDGGLKYETETYIGEDGREHTNILAAECEVPFDLTVNINGVATPLQFEEWCYTDKENYGKPKVDKDGIPLLEKRFPGILHRIAYRIPTEKEYSMMNLHIVRFSQKTAGGTIKVPAQGTTIAGFDFDIDKLYFMMREYHFEEESAEDSLVNALLSPFSGSDTADEIVEQNWSDRLLRYDTTKSPLQQHSNKNISRALRNNMLIDIIQKRLEDPETLKNRVTPGGFKNASEAARVMRELLYGSINEFSNNGEVNFEDVYRRCNDKNVEDPEPSYEVFDPMTILNYNQQNQVAGKLIGIFANQNTNYAFTSLMKKCVLSTPIELCGHMFSDLLHSPTGRDSGLTISEYLAASVDAVKDPVLNFMNFNTITADSGSLLARLGYNSEEIGLFFNQPIIKELCEFCFQEGKNVSYAISILRKKYEAELSNLNAKKATASLTKQNLANHILANRIREEKAKEGSTLDESKLKWDAQTINFQLSVLENFATISKAAGELTQLISATKFTAANAVDSTFGGMYEQQMRMDNYLQKVNSDEAVLKMQVTDSIYKPLNNSMEDLSNEEYLRIVTSENGLGNPFAFEQAMYDMNKRAIKLYSRYFPYDTPTYTRARNMARRVTASQLIDGDTINLLHRDLLIHMLRGQENSIFDGEAQRLGEEPGVTNEMYYTQVFPDLLLAFLDNNPEFKSKYAIFDYMIPDEDSNGNTILTLQDVGGLNSAQKNDITESWAALLHDEPQIAQDLFYYNYYQVGFRFSPRAFMHLTPTEVKQSIKVNRDMSYADFLDKVLDGNIEVNAQDFVKEFIKNHLDNYRFVSKLYGDFSKAVEKLATDETTRSWKKEIEITSEMLKDDSSIVINGDPDCPEGCTSFMPVIAIKNGNNYVYYMAKGNGPRFNISTGGSMVYEMIDTTSKPTEKNALALQTLQRKIAELGLEVKSKKTESNNVIIQDPSYRHDLEAEYAVYVAALTPGIINWDNGLSWKEQLDKPNVQAIIKENINLATSLSDTELINKINAGREVLGGYLLSLDTGNETSSVAVDGDNPILNYLNGVNYFSSIEGSTGAPTEDSSDTEGIAESRRNELIQELADKTIKLMLSPIAPADARIQPEEADNVKAKMLEDYKNLSDDDLIIRINTVRATMGEKVLVDKCGNNIC